jgi:putative endonuclease
MHRFSSDYAAGVRGASLQSRVDAGPWCVADPFRGEIGAEFLQGPRHHDSGSAMSWFVYLIECRGGSIYTGIARDVTARYAAHLAGKGARYTRSRPPQRLLAVFAVADRSAALREEIRIKRLSAPQKRALVAQAAPLSCAADTATA